MLQEAHSHGMESLLLTHAPVREAGFALSSHGGCAKGQVGRESSGEITYAPVLPHALPGGARCLILAERAPAPMAPDPRGLPPTEARARQADALTVELRAGLDRITSPLARSAAAFVAIDGWKELGHARLADHTRERLGRSSRWMRNLAALGRAFAEIPGLEDAVCGRDGEQAVGRVAGLLISRVATGSTLRHWVERARSLSVRELRDEVAAARAVAEESRRAARPVLQEEDAIGQAGSPDSEADVDVDDDDAGRRLVTMQMPGPVRAAFNEALELFRCVEGRESSVTEFASALVAESCASGGVMPDPIDGTHDDILRHGRPVEIRERALAGTTNRWEHLPDAGRAGWALRLARSSLEKLAELERVAGQGDFMALDLQLRSLIRLEDEIECRIGALLGQMADDGAWSRLRFDSAAHYAEQRLAMGRTAARMRIRVQRALRRLPAIRAAYEGGEVGAEAAWLVARMLRCPGAECTDIDSLVERASRSTVKRLRDELRLVERCAAGRGPGIAGEGLRRCGGQEGGCCPAEEVAPGSAGAPAALSAPRGFHAAPWAALDAGAPDVAASAAAGVSSTAVCPEPDTVESPGGDPSGIPTLPVSDAMWYAGLRREVGTSRARLARLGAVAARARVSDVFLLLRLPAGVATDLLTAVEARRRSLEQLAAEVAWDEPWPDPSPAGSVAAAREFFVRCRRLPAWVGLLSLLEEFVETWDVEQTGARAAARWPGEAAAIRDGWRCVAPGCTSRRHLESHHIHYSSRGGSDGEENRATLCRFHHQRGEHGLLATCRGQAPLELHWTLGRNGAGGSFRNELKFSPRLRTNGTGVVARSLRRRSGGPSPA